MPSVERATFSQAKPEPTVTLWLRVDDPVRLVVYSNVEGSLTIPAFRVRKDLDPRGRYQPCWFEPTRTGTYDVVLQRPGCEPQPLGTVVVLSADEWQRRF